MSGRCLAALVAELPATGVAKVGAVDHVVARQANRVPLATYTREFDPEIRLDWSSYSVGPDVALKSGSISSKSCPKIFHRNFY